MPLQTTVIGSYPKPDYLSMPDWFRTDHDKYDPRCCTNLPTDTENQIKRALKEVIHEQTDIGLDVITDGEIPRENYIFHFCRRLKNFDFDDVTFKVYRNGAVRTYVPTVVGVLDNRTADNWCAKEWREAQALTSTTVKYTLPGPMTIINTSANRFYANDEAESLALVKLLNQQVRGLAEAGCKYIQIDEPLLTREPATAVEYGIDHLSQCFQNVSGDVQKIVHLCCGYPRKLDDVGYLKADPGSYLKLAERLDSAGFNAISIEDAHCHNDLRLLEKFQKTSVILGVITVAESKVETVEEIKSVVKEALSYIPMNRLTLAPDCGLGFLPKPILLEKLKNMVAVAKSFS